MTVTLNLDRRVLVIGDATVRVSKSAARILESIARGRGDFGALTHALWPNPDLEPEWGENVIRVLIARVRHACRRAGVTAPIAAQYGAGYVATQPIEIQMTSPPVVIPARFRADLCAILAQSSARSAAAMLEMVRI